MFRAIQVVHARRRVGFETVSEPALELFAQLAQISLRGLDVLLRAFRHHTLGGHARTSSFLNESGPWRHAAVSGTFPRRVPGRSDESRDRAGSRAVSVVVDPLCDVGHTADPERSTAAGSTRSQYDLQGFWNPFYRLTCTKTPTADTAVPDLRAVRPDDVVSALPDLVTPIAGPRDKDRRQSNFLEPVLRISRPSAHLLR